MCLRFSTYMAMLYSQLNPLSNPGRVLVSGQLSTSEFRCLSSVYKADHVGLHLSKPRTFTYELRGPRITLLALQAFQRLSMSQVPVLYSLIQTEKCKNDHLCWCLLYPCSYTWFGQSLNIPFVFSVGKNSTLARQQGLAVVLILKIN